MTLSASEQARRKAARAERKERTSEDVGRIFSDAGSRAALADDTGVPHQHVSAWCDPLGAKGMALHDARATKDREKRRQLGELVLGDEFVAVRRHVAGEGALTVKAAANMLRASSCVVDTMLEALADGHVDPAEARELLRKLDALLCDGESLRTALLAVEPKRSLVAVGR